MANYRCEVCHFVYKEESEGIAWDDLHEGWVCPVCNSPKSVFILLEEKAEKKKSPDLDESSPIVTRVDKSAENTISDVMIETMINWGVSHVFGMVGHSNLGLADALSRIAPGSG